MCLYLRVLPAELPGNRVSPTDSFAEFYCKFDGLGRGLLPGGISGVSQKGSVATVTNRRFQHKIQLELSALHGRKPVALNPVGLKAR